MDDMPMDAASGGSPGRAASILANEGGDGSNGALDQLQNTVSDDASDGQVFGIFYHLQANGLIAPAAAASRLQALARAPTELLSLIQDNIILQPPSAALQPLLDDELTQAIDLSADLPDNDGGAAAGPSNGASSTYAGGATGNRELLPAAGPLAPLVVLRDLLWSAISEWRSLAESATLTGRMHELSTLVQGMMALLTVLRPSSELVDLFYCVFSDKGRGGDAGAAGSNDDGRAEEAPDPEMTVPSDRARLPVPLFYTHGLLSMPILHYAYRMWLYWESCAVPIAAAAGVATFADTLRHRIQNLERKWNKWERSFAENYSFAAAALEQQQRSLRLPAATTPSEAADAAEAVQASWVAVVADCVAAGQRQAQAEVAEAEAAAMAAAQHAQQLAAEQQLAMEQASAEAEAAAAQQAQHAPDEPADGSDEGRNDGDDDGAADAAVVDADDNGNDEDEDDDAIPLSSLAPHRNAAAAAAATEDDESDDEGEEASAAGGDARKPVRRSGKPWKVGEAKYKCMRSIPVSTKDGTTTRTAWLMRVPLPDDPNKFYFATTRRYISVIEAEALFQAQCKQCGLNAADFLRVGYPGDDAARAKDPSRRVATSSSSSSSSAGAAAGRDSKRVADVDLTTVSDHSDDDYDGGGGAGSRSGTGSAAARSARSSLSSAAAASSSGYVLGTQTKRWVAGTGMSKYAGMNFHAKDNKWKFVSAKYGIATSRIKPNVLVAEADFEELLIGAGVKPGDLKNFIRPGYPGDELALQQDPARRRAQRQLDADRQRSNTSAGAGAVAPAAAAAVELPPRPGAADAGIIIQGDNDEENDLIAQEAREAEARLAQLEQEGKEAFIGSFGAGAATMSFAKRLAQAQAAARPFEEPQQAAASAAAAAASTSSHAPPNRISALSDDPSKGPARPLISWMGGDWPIIAPRILPPRKSGKPHHERLPTAEREILMPKYRFHVRNEALYPRDANDEIVPYSTPLGSVPIFDERDSCLDVYPSLELSETERLARRICSYDEVLRIEAQKRLALLQKVPARSAMKGSRAAAVAAAAAEAAVAAAAAAGEATIAGAVPTAGADVGSAPARRPVIPSASPVLGTSTRTHVGAGAGAGAAGAGAALATAAGAGSARHGAAAGDQHYDEDDDDDMLMPQLGGGGGGAGIGAAASSASSSFVPISKYDVNFGGRGSAGPRATPADDDEMMLADEDGGAHHSDDGDKALAANAVHARNVMPNASAGAAVGPSSFGVPKLPPSAPPGTQRSSSTGSASGATASAFPAAAPMLDATMPGAAAAAASSKNATTSSLLSAFAPLNSLSSEPATAPASASSSAPANSLLQAPMRWGYGGLDDDTASTTDAAAAVRLQGQQQPQMQHPFMQSLQQPPPGFQAPPSARPFAAAAASSSSAAPGAPAGNDADEDEDDVMGYLSSLGGGGSGSGGGAKPSAGADNGAYAAVQMQTYGGVATSAAGASAYLGHYAQQATSGAAYAPAAGEQISYAHYNHSSALLQEQQQLLQHQQQVSNFGYQQGYEGPPALPPASSASSTDHMAGGFALAHSSGYSGGGYSVPRPLDYELLLTAVRRIARDRRGSGLEVPGSSIAGAIKDAKLPVSFKHAEARVAELGLPGLVIEPSPTPQFPDRVIWRVVDPALLMASLTSAAAALGVPPPDVPEYQKYVGGAHSSSAAPASAATAASVDAAALAMAASTYTVSTVEDYRLLVASVDAIARSRLINGLPGNEVGFQLRNSVGNVPRFSQRVNSLHLPGLVITEKAAGNDNLWTITDANPVAIALINAAAALGLQPPNTSDLEQLHGIQVQARSGGGAPAWQRVDIAWLRAVVDVVGKTKTRSIAGEDLVDELRRRNVMYRNFYSRINGYQVPGLKAVELSSGGRQWVVSLELDGGLEKAFQALADAERQLIAHEQQQQQKQQQQQHQQQQQQQHPQQQQMMQVQPAAASSTDAGRAMLPVLHATVVGVGQFDAAAAASSYQLGAASGDDRSSSVSPSMSTMAMQEPAARQRPSELGIADPTIRPVGALILPASGDTALQQLQSEWLLASAHGVDTEVGSSAGGSAAPASASATASNAFPMRPAIPWPSPSSVSSSSAAASSVAAGSSSSRAGDANATDRVRATVRHIRVTNIAMGTTSITVRQALESSFGPTEQVVFIDRARPTPGKPGFYTDSQFAFIAFLNPADAARAVAAGSLRMPSQSLPLLVDYDKKEVEKAMAAARAGPSSQRGPERTGARPSSSSSSSSSSALLPVMVPANGATGRAWDLHMDCTKNRRQVANITAEFNRTHGLQPAAQEVEAHQAQSNDAFRRVFDQRVQAVSVANARSNASAASARTFPFRERRATDVGAAAEQVIFGKVKSDLRFDPQFHKTTPPAELQHQMRQRLVVEKLAHPAAALPFPAYGFTSADAQGHVIITDPSVHIGSPEVQGHTWYAADGHGHTHVGEAPADGDDDYRDFAGTPFCYVHCNDDWRTYPGATLPADPATLLYSDRDTWRPAAIRVPAAAAAAAGAGATGTVPTCTAVPVRQQLSSGDRTPLLGACASAAGIGSRSTSPSPALTGPLATATAGASAAAGSSGVDVSMASVAVSNKRGRQDEQPPQEQQPPQQQPPQHDARDVGASQDRSSAPGLDKDENQHYGSNAETDSSSQAAKRVKTAINKILNDGEWERLLQGERASVAALPVMQDASYASSGWSEVAAPVAVAVPPRPSSRQPSPARQVALPALQIPPASASSNAGAAAAMPPAAAASSSAESSSAAGPVSARSNASGSSAVSSPSSTTAIAIDDEARWQKPAGCGYSLGELALMRFVADAIHEHPDGKISSQVLGISVRKRNLLSKGAGAQGKIGAVFSRLDHNHLGIHIGDAANAERMYTLSKPYDVVLKGIEAEERKVRQANAANAANATTTPISSKEAIAAEEASGENEVQAFPTAAAAIPIHRSSSGAATAGSSTEPPAAAPAGAAGADDDASVLHTQPSTGGWTLSDIRLVRVVADALEASPDRRVNGGLFGQAIKNSGVSLPPWSTSDTGYLASLNIPWLVIGSDERKLPLFTCKPATDFKAVRRMLDNAERSIRRWLVADGVVQPTSSSAAVSIHRSSSASASASLSIYRSSSSATVDSEVDGGGSSDDEPEGCAAAATSGSFKIARSSRAAGASAAQGVTTTPEEQEAALLNYRPQPSGWNLNDVRFLRIVVETLAGVRGHRLDGGPLGNTLRKVPNVPPLPVGAGLTTFIQSLNCHGINVGYDEEKSTTAVVSLVQSPGDLIRKLDRADTNLRRELGLPVPSRPALALPASNPSPVASTGIWNSSLMAAPMPQTGGAPPPAPFSIIRAGSVAPSDGGAISAVGGSGPRLDDVNGDDGDDMEIEITDEPTGKVEGGGAEASSSGTTALAGGAQGGLHAFKLNLPKVAAPPPQDSAYKAFAAPNVPASDVSAAAGGASTPAAGPLVVMQNVRALQGLLLSLDSRGREKQAAQGAPGASASDDAPHAARSGGSHSARSNKPSLPAVASTRHHEVGAGAGTGAGGGRGSTDRGTDRGHKADRRPRSRSRCRDRSKQDRYQGAARAGTPSYDGDHDHHRGDGRDQARGGSGTDPRQRPGSAAADYARNRDRDPDARDRDRDRDRAFEGRLPLAPARDVYWHRDAPSGGYPPAGGVGSVFLPYPPPRPSSSGPEGYGDEVRRSSTSPPRYRDDEGSPPPASSSATSAS